MAKPLLPHATAYEGNDRYEGYCADLAGEVAKLINIEYVIEPVKDGKYGNKNDNGSWSGMIGEVITGVGDALCFWYVLKSGLDLGDIIGETDGD